MHRTLQTTRFALALFTGALLAVTVAPANAQSPEEMGAAMGMAGVPAELPELITLTDQDVAGLISVGQELKALGISLESKPGGASLEQKLAGQQQAGAILQRANFTPERMQEVAFSVGLAMAALEEDFEEARAQLAEMEKMKSSMPPEQWQMMQGMMGPAMQMMEQAMNQPAGNIALARKYESELRALGD